MAASALGVVVVGSANVDLIVRVDRLPAPGETVTGGTFDRQRGGKGANQAAAAARFGALTWFVGAVGDDALATEIVEGLREAGVATTGVAHLSGVTSGVAAIVVDASGENQIAVASGANARLDGSIVTTALEAMDPNVVGVCLVGFEIGDEAVMAAARWARRADSVLVVNPAPARPMPPGLSELRPILTPNRGEAALLAEADDIRRAAERLRVLTGSPVVVTLGPEGALLVDPSGQRIIPAPTIDPVDATGAGDAFNGILAAELADGRPIEEAVKSGVIGASLATRRVGAQAGLPTRAEVEALAGDRA